MSATIISENPTVQPDSFLTLHYRIALDEGERSRDIVNTFIDKPATLQLGRGQLVVALEQCLVGLTLGQQHVFRLAGDNAYGQRHPTLVQKISRRTLAQQSAPDAHYNPGDWVEFPTPNGGHYAGTLIEINAVEACFDFNHPLAGKAIVFEAKILGIL